jgi:hypothetical protein
MFMAKLLLVYSAPVIFLAQHFETFYGKRTALFLLHCHFDHHFGVWKAVTDALVGGGKISQSEAMNPQ